MPQSVLSFLFSILLALPTLGSSGVGSGPPQAPEVIRNPETGQPSFVAESVLQRVLAAPERVGQEVGLSQAWVSSLERSLEWRRRNRPSGTPGVDGLSCDTYQADGLEHGGFDLKESGEPVTVTSLARNSELVAVGQITDIVSGYWGQAPGSLISVVVSRTLKNSKRAPLHEPSILLYERSYSLQLGDLAICQYAEDRYRPREGDTILMLLRDGKELGAIYHPHLLFKIEADEVRPPRLPVLFWELAPIGLDVLSEELAAGAQGKEW